MRGITTVCALRRCAALACATLWLLASTIAFAAPLQLPDAYTQGDASPVSDTPWWELLNAPVLEGHIEGAVRDNHEIRMAHDRLVMARAAALQTASGLMPTVSADLSWSTQPFDTFGFSFQALNMNSIPEFTLPAPGTSTPPTGTPTGTGTGGTGGTTTGSAFPDLSSLGTSADAEEDPDLFHSGQYTLTARWNIDLFGRQTMTWRASIRSPRHKAMRAMVLGVTGQWVKPTSRRCSRATKPTSSRSTPIKPPSSTT